MPLLRLFFDICLLKKGPQHVPASRFLLYLTAVLYLGLGFLLLFLSADWSAALHQAVVEMVLTLAFLYTLLSLKKMPERFLQTATAVLGTDVIFSLCALIILGLPNSPTRVDIPDLLMLTLMGWSLLVTGHILRHALKKTLVYGTVVALLYMLVASQIMAILFPPSF